MLTWSSITSPARLIDDSTEDIMTQMQCPAKYKLHPAKHPDPKPSNSGDPILPYPS